MAANSISEVISELDVIVKDSIRNGDRNGYFAALYKNVTIAVAEKIKQGYFEDNERMEQLDVVFANRYLQAYAQYKSGMPCSLSWHLAFEAAATWKPTVLHHLFAGMNAHIGLDLGIAAAMVAPGPAIAAIEGDFNKINDVLKSMVDEVKSDIFSMWPLSNLLTRWKTGKLENEIAGFSMVVARDAAWQVARDYAALTGTAAKADYIAKRDVKVAVFGKKLLNPGMVVSLLMYGLRLFETGSVPEKIRRLDEV